MSALAFLGFALLVSAIGIAVLSYSNRTPSRRRRGGSDSIKDFQRELDALRPRNDDRDDRGPQN